MHDVKNRAKFEGRHTEFICPFGNTDHKMI